MLKIAASVFGAAFLIAGLLGFIPATAPGGMLFGILHVNAAHNVVHLLTGVVALLAAYNGARASQLFFQIFGVIYGLVAILGFMVGDRPIMGMIANNIADAWFHLIVAAVSLYLGFSKRLVHRPLTT
jgi:Domain of unknown function (DUF4383)